MEKILISVVVPAYNVSQYIDEALVSALAQLPSNSEIIVIDDGSTDNTAEIVTSIGDDRIKYHYQANAGLGPARNTGIMLAQGELIYFLDSDDRLVKGVIDFCLSAFEKNSLLDIVAFSAVNFDSDTGGNFPGDSQFKWKKPGLFKSGKDAMIAQIEWRWMPACAWLFMIKRTALEKDLPLRFKSILHEDEAFTPELFMRCKQTLIVNDIYYEHRVRSGSIMTSASTDRNVEGQLAAASVWRHMAQKECGYTRNQIIKQICKLYCAGLSYAERSKTNLLILNQMANKYVPNFSSFIKLDLRLVKSSKRLAVQLIYMRELLKKKKLKNNYSQP